MNPKVLLVDDEENIVLAYQRNLRHKFDLEVATSGQAGLQILREGGPFAVVVADMLMPEMDGLEFLMHVRTLDPDISRIMLTGVSDQKTAVDAVNHGRVFRFLNKPCEMDELSLAILAGLRQYELLQSEKKLLEETLSGAVEAMTDLLIVMDPRAFGYSQILKKRALKVARALELEREWEIGLAAVLSSIGRLTLSPQLLLKLQNGQGLTSEEQALVRRVPIFGARLLQRIPRMEGVADAIHYQARGFDGSGFPSDGPIGKNIPIAARILKPLLDMLQAEHEARSPIGALQKLQYQSKLYDPEVLAAIIKVTESDLGMSEEQHRPKKAVPLNELMEGDVLASHVTTNSGRFVLFSGIRLSAGHIQLLHNLGELLDLKEPIFIEDKPQ